MKTERPPARDVREERSEREKKLGQVVETLPGKTLRDRLPNSRATKTRAARARATAPVLPVPESALSPNLMLPVVVSRTRNVWFRLDAPAASRVCVAGTFNNWNPTATPLAKSKEGEWRVEMHLAPGQYEYRFVLDGIWQEDPQAKSVVPNPFGSRNCIIQVA